MGGAKSSFRDVLRSRYGSPVRAHQAGELAIGLFFNLVVHGPDRPVGQLGAAGISEVARALWCGVAQDDLLVDEPRAAVVLADARAFAERCNAPTVRRDEPT